MLTKSASEDYFYFWLVKSVDPSFQQNTIYGLIILREAVKQLALIAESFSSQNMSRNSGLQFEGENF